LSIFIPEDQCLYTANILKSDDFELPSKRSITFANTSVTNGGICFRIPIKCPNRPNIGRDDDDDDDDNLCLHAGLSLKLNDQILLM
jgi:hypothetical protein